MKIVSTHVLEGPLYQLNDGGAFYNFFVVAVAVDGTEYIHNKSFSGYGSDEEGSYADLHAPIVAEKFSKKVRVAGVIDPSFWTIKEPSPSYALGEVDEVSLMDDEERIRKGY